MEVVLANTTLAAADYYDRVFACWLGKNCGGTLGQPLEEAFGRRERFDVWWYPELAEGGIPNDDLEMQLVWLMAVVERWPVLTARTLSDYWLDHIGYNYDEYGFSKTNLRLGLVPPVSGRHNNWFVDCMGSPIRSEIWACLAPGVPALAARLAYQDAICDHAGGEGVYGELFNASIESSAFVIKDMDELLDIAMSYIPEDCQVARAIRSARASHRAGIPWTEARENVLETVPHYVAQYAPINLGFQVIAWLYGDDFGDAICKAVNCGYDTDCTGATVGSLLGILSGRAGLPARWTDPLGHNIATSESTGGIKHVSDGAFRIPDTLDELSSIVCGLGERLLSTEGSSMRIGDVNHLEGVSASGQRAGPLEIQFIAPAPRASVNRDSHRLWELTRRSTWGRKGDRSRDRESAPRSFGGQRWGPGPKRMAGLSADKPRSARRQFSALRDYSRYRRADRGQEREPGCYRCSNHRQTVGHGSPSGASRAAQMARVWTLWAYGRRRAVPV